MSLFSRAWSLYSRRSLIFRLWLALTVICLVVGSSIATAYGWTTLNGEIHTARDEVHVKQETVAVFTSMGQRLQTTGGFAFAQSDYRLLRDMGVLSLSVYDDSGNLELKVDPYDEIVGVAQSYASTVPLSNSVGYEVIPDSTTNIDPALVEKAKTEGPQYSDVRFEDANASPAKLSPLRLVTGGQFGGEVWSSPDPGATQQTLFQYSDLAGAARRLVLELGIAAIVSSSMLGLVWWQVLRRMIYRPLLAYSNVAVEIAAGASVRMPAHGNDELAGLAHAINSMADVLENKATIDALTGLNNLRHMSDHLESLIKSAAREEQPLSLVVADLDRFKPINDTYGHLAGDRVLQTIGGAMRRWAGNDFICWRLGGDEFAIALPGLDPAAAQRHAENLRHLINNLSVRVSDGVVRPQISVGVASCPEDGDSVGTLLGMADRRMYQAKRAAYTTREPIEPPLSA